MAAAVFPAKLRPGAHVRVVAPSTSRSAVPTPWRAIAEQRTADLGLTLSFGAHVDEAGRFETAPAGARLDDLHAAFADPSVDGVMTFLGGYHANQLLDGLDLDLVRANPKVLCGYSDITVLHHALLAGADLVTYSGPHWSSLGMRDHFSQTLAWFRACLFDQAPVHIRPTSQWTDDAWYADQDAREVRATDGWWVLGEGEARGRILGGNLCTLNLLQGTRWWPEIGGALLVVEDDFESDVHAFARNLQSLLHQPGGERIAGLVIGRFQAASGVERADVEEVVASIDQLRGLPVVANADVGHTNPWFTFPVGGAGRLVADPADPHLILEEH